jgi:hypothetical protein
VVARADADCAVVRLDRAALEPRAFDQRDAELQDLASHVGRGAGRHAQQHCVGAFEVAQVRCHRNLGKGRLQGRARLGPAHDAHEARRLRLDHRVRAGAPEVSEADDRKPLAWRCYCPLPGSA